MVIQSGHLPAADRLVPVGLVEPGPEIRLGCSLDEFDRLEPAEGIDLVQRVDYTAAAAVRNAGFGDVGSMGAGASVSGMGSAWTWAAARGPSPATTSWKVRP